MTNNTKQTRPFPITRAAWMTVFCLLLLFTSGAFVAYALYQHNFSSNEAKVQAGGFSVSAEYVKIEGTKVDTDSTSPNYGRIITFTENKNKALSDTPEDIFEIECAAPTVTQTATFTVGNTGDTAFNCEIRVCDLSLDTANAAASEALSEQMLIRIACGTSFVEFRLADDADAASVLTIANVAPNAGQTFTVTATFLNDVDFNNDGDPANDFNNMDAIGGSVSFDITVIATQSADVVTP